MIGLLPTNHIIDYITWHTRVYEDTSVANSEIAQTTQNITWSFMVRKLSL